METPNVTSDDLYFSLITIDFERNLAIQSNYIAPCITICYLMFTKVIGPNIMKNRKPMDLQLTMLLHNFILIALNAYLSSQVIIVAVEMWPYHCNLKDSPVYTETRKYHNLGFLIFIVKLIELFQTGLFTFVYALCVSFSWILIPDVQDKEVIYILRKKLQQVTFFHVYHHAIVFFLSWICMKFLLIGTFNGYLMKHKYNRKTWTIAEKEGYYAILFGSINLSLHVPLYLYYALAALGPGVRKYLWWKKYLIILEIVQFFVVMAYMAYNYMTGCDKYSHFDEICFAGVATVAALFLSFHFGIYHNK